MNKGTVEQLVDTLGNDLEITITRDVVHGLLFEYKNLQQRIDEAIKYIENDVAYNELALKNKDCFENDLLRILRGDSND